MFRRKELSQVKMIMDDGQLADDTAVVVGECAGILRMLNMLRKTCNRRWSCSNIRTDLNARNGRLGKRRKPVFFPRD